MGVTDLMSFVGGRVRRCFGDVAIQALLLSTVVLRYSVHFMVSVKLKGAGERGGVLVKLQWRRLSP